MSQHHAEHLELCAGWVLDCLDEDTRQEFEAHRRAGCPECEAEILRLGQAVPLLGWAAPAATPPAQLKALTLAKVSQLMAAESGAPTPWASTGRVVSLPRRGPASWATWAGAVAAGLLAIASAGLWREVLNSRHDLEVTRRALLEAENQLEVERQWASLLGAMDARSVSLEPTPDGAAGLRARGTWDPTTRRAVIVFENVGAPGGHDYELWGLHSSGPRSLGLVKADASGRAVVRVDDAGESATLTAFALSLEQSGGSGNPSAPAGPVVMVGRIGG